MIPVNRPVIGDDVNQLRTKLGISAVEMAYLIGMTMPKYSKMVSADKYEPVSSPTIDLIVRVLDEDPSLSLLPDFIKPAALKDRLDNIRKTELKRLSIITGREASNGYRLISRKSRPAPMLSRTMSLLASRLDQAHQKDVQEALIEEMIKALGDLHLTAAKAGQKVSPPELKKALDAYQKIATIRSDIKKNELLELDRWEQLVETVATSRGVQNIFRAGRWTPVGATAEAADEHDEDEN